MSEILKSNSRLKDAFHRIAVPAGLETTVRARVDAEAALRKTTDRLRTALESTPAPPFLEARIRGSVGSTPPQRRWLFWMAPLASASALLAVLITAYQFGYLRYTAASRESYFASVSTQIPTLLRVGLGDHLHCSVFRKLPGTPPSTEEFLKKMNPKYAGLIPIVRSHVESRYRMMQAHECRYHGRRFVHLSLSDSSNLMSLIVTAKSPGESFQAGQLLPQLAASGIPMYGAGVQRFQISAFETKGYLVYFISDLPLRNSNEIMLALGPSVREYLGKIEL